MFWPFKRRPVQTMEQLAAEQPPAPCGEQTEQVLIDARAALAAPAPQAPAWQPIETAPKDGRKLILAYRNRNNKARTVMARWLTDEEAAETDADGVGLEGGWYECIDNWDDYTEVAIHEGEPSHWMPLPAAPQTKEPTNDR